MLLWLVQREDDYGYDEFTSAVICATSEHAARHIHPGNDDGSGPVWDSIENKWLFSSGHPIYDNWPNPKELKVTLIGLGNEVAMENPVVHSSYHAG